MTTPINPADPIGPTTAYTEEEVADAMMVLQELEKQHRHAVEKVQETEQALQRATESHYVARNRVKGLAYGLKLLQGRVNAMMAPYRIIGLEK